MSKTLMQPNQQPTWEYHPDGEQTPAQPQPEEPTAQQSEQNQTTLADSGDVVWSADEYIQHDRGNSWFLVLFIGAILLSGVLYLIAKDIGTSVIIIILAGIVAAFARRKPGIIEYRISVDGIHIGGKYYPFNLFKSFSIMEDTGLRSIFLTPLKRLMPPLTVYYSLNDEAKIIEILGNHLPEEQRKPEAVERLARRLRF